MPENYLVLDGNAYYLDDDVLLAAPVSRFGEIFWLQHVEVDFVNIENPALARRALTVLNSL